MTSSTNCRLRISDSVFETALNLIEDKSSSSWFYLVTQSITLTVVSCSSDSKVLYILDRVRVPESSFILSTDNNTRCLNCSFLGYEKTAPCGFYSGVHMKEKDSVTIAGSQGTWEFIIFVFERFRNKCLEMPVYNAVLKPGRKPGCKHCNLSQLLVNLSGQC